MKAAFMLDGSESHQTQGLVRSLALRLAAGDDEICLVSSGKLSAHLTEELDTQILPSHEERKKFLQENEFEVLIFSSPFIGYSLHDIRLPAIHFVHEMDYVLEDSDPYRKNLFKGLLQYPYRICVTGKFQQKGLEQKYDTSSTVISPGVEDCYFFKREKGEGRVRVLVETSDLGPEDIDKIDFLVSNIEDASGGELAINLLAVESISSPHHVIVARSDKERVDALARHDILLTHSGTNDFDVRSMQAMASGMAVVTTNVGGTQEFGIHERNMLIVRSERSDALVNALTTLAGNPTKCSFLGHNARKTVQVMEWKPSVAALRREMLAAVEAGAPVDWQPDSRLLGTYFSFHYASRFVPEAPLPVLGDKLFERYFEERHPPEELLEECPACHQKLIDEGPDQMSRCRNCRLTFANPPREGIGNLQPFLLFNMSFMVQNPAIMPFRTTKFQQSMRLLADHNTTNIYRLLTVSFTEPEGLKEYNYFKKRTFLSPAYLENDAFFRGELSRDGDRKIVFLFDCMEFITDLEWPFKFFFGESQHVDFLAFNVTNTESFAFRRFPEKAYRLSHPVTRQILEPAALESICSRYGLTVSENIFLGRREEPEYQEPEQERSLFKQLRKQLVGGAGPDRGQYEDRLFMVRRESKA